MSGYYLPESIIEKIRRHAFLKVRDSSPILLEVFCAPTNEQELERWPGWTRLFFVADVPQSIIPYIGETFAHGFGWSLRVERVIWRGKLRQVCTRKVPPLEGMNYLSRLVDRRGAREASINAKFVDRNSIIYRAELHGKSFERNLDQLNILMDDILWLPRIKE